MPSDAETTTTEEDGIARFLSLVSEMLLRSDFLLPLAAGQRQFRQDNYQMASAAQLEDLFFDCFGTFLRENHPALVFERRTGKEDWDYSLDGLLLSHKETLGPGISPWWTAGNEVAPGKWVPKPGKETYSSKCPFVIVYSGCPQVGWTCDDPAVAVPKRGRAPVARRGTLLAPLGVRSIDKKKKASPSTANTLVLARQVGIAELEVEKVWPSEDWADLTFHDMWPDLGGPLLREHDLWVDKVYASSSMGLATVATLAVGARLQLTGEPLLPGVYVIPTAQVQKVPMEANNRAHSIVPNVLHDLMDDARRSNRYVPIPSWFAHFADAPPPNLYGIQRKQYEELFAARRRSED